MSIILAQDPAGGPGLDNLIWLIETLLSISVVVLRVCLILLPILLGFAVYKVVAAIRARRERQRLRQPPTNT